MTPFTDANMNDFFATLPSEIRQQILQSPTLPTSAAELKTLAAKLTDIRPHSTPRKNEWL